MTNSRRHLCSICAWRLDCRKRFLNRSSVNVRFCPDYTRDVSLPDEPDSETDPTTRDAPRKRYLDIDRDLNHPYRPNTHKENED